MRTRLGLAISLLVVSSGSLLSHGKDVTYFCVTEFSAGAAYNANANRWQGTNFRGDKKFVLRMKYVESGVEKNSKGEAVTVHRYVLSLTKAGDNYAANAFPLISNRGHRSSQCTARPMSLAEVSRRINST
jgi:hypothetical protein